MTVTIPLPVFPFPMSGERHALLKAAKASLNLPYLIVPVEAFLGSPGRVLCFEGKPKHICETAPILPENFERVESIAAALKFALTADPTDQRFGWADWLSQALGCEVVYSHTEVDGQVQFRDG